MRVTKHEDLVLLRTALSALHRTIYSRIMRGRAETGDARAYILVGRLLARACDESTAVEKEVTASKIRELAREAGVPQDVLDKRNV